MLQETGDRCCTVGLLFGCKYSKIFVSLALCLWAGWRSRYSNWLHSGRSWDQILVGGGEIFLAHLPDLGPTEPLVQQVPGLSQG